MRLEEVVEQRLARRRCRRGPVSASQVGAARSRAPASVGTAALDAGRHAAPGAGMARDRVGLDDRTASSFFSQAVLVGREHAVGLAAAASAPRCARRSRGPWRCAGRCRGRRARRAPRRRARGRTGRRRGWRRPPARAARSPGATISSPPAPWRTIRRTPCVAVLAGRARRRSASSAATLSRMNSTRRSARGSGSRMARSKTKAHQTWRAAFSAWYSAAWSSARRSRRNQTSAASSDLSIGASSDPEKARASADPRRVAAGGGIKCAAWPSRRST